MDVMTMANGSPTQPATQAFMTITATAEEWQRFIEVATHALSEGPQAFDARTSSGCAMRVVCDRVGLPVARQ